MLPTPKTYYIIPPPIKTYVTNIHPLQSISIPSKSPMSGRLTIPLFIRPPNIRGGERKGNSERGGVIFKLVFFTSEKYQSQSDVRCIFEKHFHP